MPLEIAKMLVLSTAHISSGTRLRLTSWPSSLPIFYEKEDYGWLFPITPDDIESWVPFDDLLVIRKLARDNNCSWVMFDRDGDVVEGLPTHEWSS